MEQTKRTVDLSNKLIALNNDRAEWYAHAIKNITGVSNMDIKSLFEELMEQALRFAKELHPFVVVNGKEPTTGTTAAGMFQRLWQDVKSTLVPIEREELLAKCAGVELKAQELYNGAIDSAPSLSEKLLEHIQIQADRQNRSYEKILHFQKRQNVPSP